MAASTLSRPSGTVLFLTVLVFIGTSVSAAIANPCLTVQGDILVPTGTHNPPPVHTKAMEQVFLIKYIENPVPLRSYELKAAGAVTTTCVGSTCEHIPDFDVAWYDLSGNLVQEHDFKGDQSGSVPANTEYGVVYMAHGPDAGTTDASVLARFIYTESC